MTTQFQVVNRLVEPYIRDSIITESHRNIARFVNMSNILPLGLVNEMLAQDA